MQLPPPSVMANWPTPNYENPETQGLPLIIVNVIFMALISLAVPLRLYSRYVTKGRLGWDDFNMGAAYVRTVDLVQLRATADLCMQICGMALGVIVILANVRFQWNRHLWDVEFTMFESASKVALATKLLFTFAGAFTRASLICFYFRLIKDTGRSLFKYVLWAAFAYNIAICVVFVILAVFLCS
mgnify:CR=1 FL=1